MSPRQRRQPRRTVSSAGRQKGSTSCLRPVRRRHTAASVGWHQQSRPGRRRPTSPTQPATARAHAQHCRMCEPLHRGRRSARRADRHRSDRLVFGSQVYRSSCAVAMHCITIALHTRRIIGRSDYGPRSHPARSHASPGGSPPRTSPLGCRPNGAGSVPGGGAAERAHSGRARRALDWVVGVWHSRSGTAAS